MEDVKKEMKKLTKAQLVDKCVELTIRVDEMDDEIESHRNASIFAIDERIHSDKSFQEENAANRKLAETVERQEKNIETLIAVIRKKEGLGQ